MKSFRIYIKVITYAVFLFLLIISFSRKFNVNVDEVFSYGLANHYGDSRMTFKTGVRYVPANSPWMEYVTVSKDHRFDYLNVWRNQEADVHPPFYYVLLHTICSFFPERFSMWFGGVINIIFCLGSLFVFEKIAAIYIDDFSVKSILSIAYVLSPAFLNMNMFIRMYSMAMFCVLLFTYFYIRFVRGERGIAVMAALTISAVVGTMTHYYCMVFIVLLSWVYGLYCLFRKEIRTLIKFAVSMNVSAVLCVVIFPGIMQHFLRSDRGEQTISNAGSDHVLRENLGKDIAVVAGELFGNPLLIGIIALLILGLVILKTRKKTGKVSIELIFIGIAIAAYFPVIAGTAPYATDRYFFPIYGVLFLLVCVSFARLLTAPAVLKKFSKIALTFILVVIIGTAWYNMDWTYTDSFTKDSVRWAKEHSQLDAIMIRGPRYMMHTAFLEVSEYAGMTIVNRKNLSKLPDPREYENKDFVLMIAVKEADDKYLKEVADRYPGHTYNKVAYSAYHASYYFECKK